MNQHRKYATNMNTIGVDNIHYRRASKAYAFYVLAARIKFAFSRFVNIWAEPKYDTCRNCKISSEHVKFEYPHHFCSAQCLEAWCADLEPLVRS